MSGEWPDDRPAGQAEIREAIKSLASGNVSASRVLEICHWSQVPGAIEVLRAIFAMRSDDRALLRAFLALSRPGTLKAHLDESGKIILSSSEITKSVPVRRMADQVKADVQTFVVD